MIELPDFGRAFDYENDFYLASDPSRLIKAIVQWEISKRIAGVPGAIIECGVFKGASLARLATFRQLLGGAAERRLIAFDTFASFPEAGLEADRERRECFIAEAGANSITAEQLDAVLRHKRLAENVEYVAGDICTTVPEYARTSPDLQIALLHVDVDLYEPSVVILEELFPRLAPGGVLMLDDYGTFPGETRAVDEYLAGRPERVQNLDFAAKPAFVVKGKDPS